MRSFANAPEAIQKEIKKARWEWWGGIKGMVLLGKLRPHGYGKLQEGNE